MDKEFLSEIGKKMISQNNRMTQYPLFVVQEKYEFFVGSDGNWDGYHRKGDHDSELFCDSCKKIRDDGGEVPDNCNGCESECFWHYEEIDLFRLEAGVFFTAEACEEHIRLNNYHYNQPRSYAISAWRNEEMQSVMQYLCTLAGDIPSHYK